MKPTSQQQQYLSAYLSSNLVYRETYDEFYDHLLTALENEPADISFKDAVHGLVNKEFGGVTQLRQIEENYKNETLKDMKQRYLKYLTAYLKFPNVVPVIATSTIFYFMLNASLFNRSWFLAIYFLMAFVPSVINWVRAIQLGYFSKNNKRSIKDDGFTWMKYTPVTLFGGFAIYHYLFVKDTPASWFKSVNPLTITLIFMAYILHIHAYYKIYKDQFKLSLVK